jgi:hypothetical protein
MRDIKEIELESNKDYPNLIKIIRLTNFSNFPFDEFEYRFRQNNDNESKEIDFHALNEKGGRLILGISDCGGHASGFARNYELADFIDQIREEHNVKMIRHHDAGWTIFDMQTIDYVAKKIIGIMSGPFSFSFKISWKKDYRKEFINSLFKDYNKRTKIEELITQYIIKGNTKITIGRYQEYFILADKHGGLFHYTNRW